MDIVSYLLGRNSASGGGGEGGGDVDQNTLLLLHFNDTYADASQYERVPASIGQTISYGTGKFDKGFDLTTVSKGTLTYSELFDLVANDFTIDFWIYPTAFSSSNAAAGRPILGNYVRGSWTLVWEVFVSEYQGNTKKWGFRYAQDGNEIRLSSGTELVANLWQHLAVTYKKSTRKLTLYLDGIKNAETVLDFDMTAPSSQPYSFSVGNWMTNNYNCISYIDELRISNVVRYDGNFIPPNKPY